MTHFKYQVHIVAIFKIVIKLKKNKARKLEYLQTTQQATYAVTAKNT